MLRQLDLLESVNNVPVAGPMRRVLELAARVAPLDLTVLITGESGVGKERLARGIHDASRRAHGPFVPINCAALSESLLDSELFGHVSGAFTGALNDARGVFEAAHGGTLFLDEIGEVSSAMQAKLLRVLQEREIRRVGDIKNRPIDVRVIAATNRNLAEEVEQQRFRSDLYYRLRVIELQVPPLRERPEELEQLAEQLLAGVAARLQRRIVGFSQEVRCRLLVYRWPGNIRELEHAIEHACVMATGAQISIDDLPEVVRDSAADRNSPAGRLAAHEMSCILSTLKRNQGDRRRTAADLGISLSTLQRRLRRSASHGR
ncbi:MAG TPA: sigma 54-interacting transcriptional regulator [Vicinamibacterales bacterium]